ncbi:hypothetical protein N802_07555 [Knoellia sinensis KCTC 19936]|uniref:Co/Zn/Cd efflux system component n=1 Tax=Knoellia sinensis KCTC 19936 TaxID=1385520 RepID=A0A0A0JDF2_9MICO|nr:hypothetical protein [Knoellia sinensis]KGN33666.1 hypothetical protein N802_07555 [Knoellia sinensis KCTC 19936]
MRSTRGRLTFAEEEPRRGPRWIARGLILTLVALVGLGAWFGGRNLFDSVMGPRCQATAAGNTVDFDPEQMSNAATITALALKRGLPARAATIALATAIQESKLRNIRYGDRDSVGLFQQRPSQGWGTVEQILDPEYSTNKFYDALVKVDDWENGTITVVAQEVQRSAYPEAYADHEQEGRILASALAGHSPRGFACRLDDPEREADVAMIGRLLDNEYSLKPTAGDGTLSVTAPNDQIAWSVASWSVAKAIDTGITGVTIGDRQWTRSRDSDAWTWQEAESPAPARQVLLHLT